MGIFTPNLDDRPWPKPDKKGFTEVSVWIPTHTVISAYSRANHLSMCELVDLAVNEYISNHTHADMTQTRAASDPINGDGRQS